MKITFYKVLYFLSGLSLVIGLLLLILGVIEDPISSLNNQWALYKAAGGLLGWSTKVFVVAYIVKKLYNIDKKLSDEK